MTLRISTLGSFQQVLLGIRGNQGLLIRAQEQVASGRRILRPSDDPTGTARSLSLTRQLADTGRFKEAITAGLTSTNTATSGLEDASGLLAEARALVLQSMNGTLQQEDRESLAAEFDLIRAQLLEIGNVRAGDRYLFGGTKSGAPPWQEVRVGDETRVVYRGNEEQQFLRIGPGVDLPVNLPGIDIFGLSSHSGARFSNLTGLAGGTTANEGQGHADVILRHDATLAPGGLPGIALVNGGAGDTLLGDNELVIDAAAGTIRLGAGPQISIPGPPEDLSDIVVENESGGTLHLDLSGYAGGSFTGTFTGQGSASLDGSTFVALDFTQTDLELRDDARGIVLHVDTTGVERAGKELVTFGGTGNVFDLLAGLAGDLRNEEGLDSHELLGRLDDRLEEIGKNQQGVLLGLGVLGSRSQRLISAEDRVQSVELQLETLLSNERDADFAEVALDLARADLTLQTAQASGARLIQTSLLNFLR